MKSETRFGIVGCGHIGPRHAQHISDQASLVAAADVVPERAQRVAQAYGCAAFSSLEEMLSQVPEIEVVAVCTPNALHSEHAITALCAGKHVVCEKPMATTVADARRMVDEAHRTDRKLFVVKQNRFNPPIAALKRAVDEGRLGRIVGVQVNGFWNRRPDYYLSSEWKGRRHLDGGTLFTQFSHFIDLLYWIVGDVQSVLAWKDNFLHEGLIEFEDSGVVLLKMANGALGTINYTVNSYARNMEGSITLFGEKGTVKVGGQYLNVLEYQEIEDYEITGLPASRPANDYGFYQGSMSNHDCVYQNVLDVLHLDGQIATTGEDGLKTVEIIERVYAAAGVNETALYIDG